MPFQLLSKERRDTYVRHHEEDAQAAVYKDFPGALAFYTSNFSELERLVVGFRRSRETNDKNHDSKCSVWKDHACLKLFLHGKCSRTVKLDDVDLQREISCKNR